jgi:hypothetical protein
LKNHILSILLILFCLFSCNKSELKVSNERENEIVTYAKRPLKDKEYIVTTNTNTAIHLVAKVALTKCLKQYNADYGTVLIMETSAGIPKVDKSNYGIDLAGSVVKEICEHVN